MMVILSILGLVVIVAGGWYVLRRRGDVMNYHDLEEPRIHRGHEGI